MTTSIATLADDIADLLDHLGALALRTRGALLSPYRAWPAERWLGAPVDLGPTKVEDALTPLRSRVAAAGLPARHLAAVARAEADLAGVFVRYHGGALHCLSVGEWRRHVEDAYSALADALDAASAWADQLAAANADVSTRGGSGRRPDLQLLDRTDVLFTEDLARVLGVVEEVARRRRARGEFGPVVRVGRRKVVRSDAVRAALARTADGHGGDSGAE